MAEEKTKMRKAVSPETTIHVIRDILFKNEIFAIESYWYHDRKGAFASVGLRIDDLPFIVRGNGINETYALASAYGQLMERLQNLAFIPEIRASGNLPGLKIYFNDRSTSCNNSIKDKFALLKNMVLGDDETVFKNILMNETLSCFYPYYCINTDSTTYLPEKLLNLTCGANGMCAGNTPEEALIQGICEILERYIMREIYFNDLTSFPLVPDWFLQEIPQWVQIKMLREKGYEVYVKDCSLEGRLPVAGVLLKKGDQALFQAGAAPDFSIALERCLIKLFRDSDLNSISCKLQPITVMDSEKTDRQFTCGSKRKKYQYYQALQTGMGIVNPKLFENRDDFQLKNLFYCENMADCDTLKDLLNIVKQLNCEIYIRDTTFLGFPSYQVYIPGMSEITKLTPDELSLHLNDLPAARKTFFNLSEADNESVLQLIKTIENLIDTPYIEKDSILPAIHQLSLADEAVLNNIDPENVLVLLYYRIGAIQKAHDILKQYLKAKLTMDQFYDPPPFAVNHVCLLKLLEFLTEGQDLEIAKSSLYNQFEANIVEEIYNCLKNPSQTPKIWGIPACVSCDDCQYRQSCNFEPINQFIGKIQKNLSLHPVDQERIAQYLKARGENAVI